MADPVPASTQVPLLSIWFDTAKFQLGVGMSAWVIAVVIGLAVLGVFLSRQWRLGYKALEFDEAEIGVGSGKFKLKPNYTDRQVAYQVWVELSTRKIGLPIDLDHDVVAEIYDSWHSFFGVTRELIKSIPVNRVSDQSTRKIISLSIEVLNEGLRPHLTRWQARFRSWYDDKLKTAGAVYEEPQELQMKFKEFDALKTDLLAVNTKLIAYRTAMHRLVYGR
jgi:hypothetical protein